MKISWSSAASGQAGSRGNSQLVDEATDIRFRALSQLTTPKELLEKIMLLGASEVDDYSWELDQLESFGEYVDQFRVPRGSLKSATGRTGGKPTIPYSVMFSRLNSVLPCFAIRQEKLSQAAARKDDPAKRIGFNPDK